MNQLGPFLWLLVLGAALYLVMIRPARNRQRQMLEVQRALQPGLEVMTTAGLFATVSAVEDDAVLLEVAPGVVSRYAKGAIARVVTPAEQADEQKDDQAGEHRDDSTRGRTEDGSPDGPDGEPDAG